VAQSALRQASDIPHPGIRQTVFPSIEGVRSFRLHRLRAWDNLGVYCFLHSDFGNLRLLELIRYR
jgi:hypothetical protein